MHWLYVVAMVIASAVPLPLCSVPRAPGLSRTLEDETTDMTVKRTQITKAEHLQQQNSHSLDFSVPSVPDQVHFTAPPHSHQATFSVPSVPDQVNFNTSSVSEREELGYQHSYNAGTDIHRDSMVQTNSGKAFRFTQEKFTSYKNPFLKDYKLQSTVSVLGDGVHLSIAESLLALKVRNKENYDPVDPSEGSVTLSSETSLDQATQVKEFNDGGTLEAIQLGVSGWDLVPAEAELPYVHTHPRVLISSLPSPPKHPPFLIMLESGLLNQVDRGSNQEEGRDTNDTAAEEGPPPPMGPPQAHVRLGRSVLPEERRGELPVCEAVSEWVMDKKTAIDDHGRTVTVLTEVQLRSQKMKQFFYETRCRTARVGAGSVATIREDLGLSGERCRGVDHRQWASECKAKHSYVRALTSDSNNRVGWRWIRINSSCVCVLLYRVTRT